MVRLKRKFLDPAKMLAAAPSGWAWLDENPGISLNLAAPAPLQDAADLAAGKFTFINQTADLGSPVDWSAAGMPRLWAYNLHYFDWIWSFGDGEVLKTRRLEDEKIGSCEDFKTAALQDFPTSRLQAIRLVEDWIDNHPPSRSAGGWEPYPISLRLMNWALLFGVRYRDALEDSSEFKFKLLESIARQVKWLEVNLETHIQANHLLENLVALVCVGKVMGGSSAERVLRKYQPMLERELEEQFLDDGMHYERSPMYHLRMLWLLEVLGRLEVLKSGSREDLKLLERGKAALSKLRHPDGEIALFNDAVTGIYPDLWKSEKTESGAWSLADAGYYGYRDTVGNYLIVDAGAVGPDYQPGHAHADYLSFELSLNGKRIITDTGIGTYDAGERRSYDRSTAAHSTVEIAGQNSAEVWGGFRVGRRVTPKVEQWTGSESAMQLRASHDGYAHLPSKAMHSRSFKWAGEVLVIEDEVVVVGDEFAINRLHFSPECEVELGVGALIVRIDGAAYRCSFDSSCQASIEVHPSCVEFGVSRDRPVLVMKHDLKHGPNKWSVRMEQI